MMMGWWMCWGGGGLNVLVGVLLVREWIALEHKRGINELNDPLKLPAVYPHIHHHHAMICSPRERKKKRIPENPPHLAFPTSTNHPSPSVSPLPFTPPQSTTAPPPCRPGTPPLANQPLGPGCALPSLSLSPLSIPASTLTSAQVSSPVLMPIAWRVASLMPAAVMGTAGTW